MILGSDSTQVLRFQLFSQLRLDSERVKQFLRVEDTVLLGVETVRLEEVVWLLEIEHVGAALSLRVGEEGGGPG